MKIANKKVNTDKLLNKEGKKLETEWIIAQGILGELNTNDLSKESYDSKKNNGLLRGKISWETWKRYYTENLTDMLCRLEDSTEYKNFEGIICPINEVLKNDNLSDEREETSKDVGFSDKKNKKKLKNFILDENQLPQIIDHAVGKIKVGKKYFRYYGVKINEIILKKQKGGLAQVTQLSSAMILEDGNIITEHNKPEDANFIFDSVMTLKRNRWGLKSIKNFCQGKIEKENYSFEKVFDSFKKFYKESMVFENKNWYSLLALRDMKSYFWDLNDKFMIIKHEGLSGAAKSKGMKIGANLSFNGKKFLCPTPANFFRYRHHNKATLFIEEAERLFNDSKKKNNADSELVEYLNGSYEKGNTVPRQNDKDINLTDEFDPSGDTAIGSIKPLKGALEKRSLSIQMIKAQKNDSRGNIEIPSEANEEYSDARNKVYVCGLLNYREYEKSLKIVKNEFGLANREWLLAKPLIALSSCISQNLEKEIGNFIAEKFVVRDDFFDDNSWERIMAESLIEIFCKKSDDSFISTNNIKFHFLQKIGGEYKISTHKISKIINELGFSDYKSRNSVGTERGYNIDFFKLCEILIRNDYITLENVLKKVSEVSVCPFSDNKINKWYTDTFLTKDTFIKNKTNISDTSDRLTLNSGVDKQKNTSNFTDKEIKKAGYSDEEIENFHKEGVL